MNITTFSLIFWMTLISCNSKSQSMTNSGSHDYQGVAKSLLEALKSGESTSKYLDILSNSTEDALLDQLVTDAERIAFWVNVYNAYIQVKLKDQPELYENRGKFFKKEQIKIGGQLMSFADIEHGIIRRSQFEYFLGYVRNPFVARYKKKFRPQKKEFRVHFALNCGAKSCPPVAIYTPENLDAELDASATQFLNKFSNYDEQKNEVLTTPLFSWFRGDFGGKRGTKRILERYNIVPSKDVELKFDSYDWTLDLDNYIID